MADDRPPPQSAIVDRYVAEAFAQECDDIVFLVRRVQTAVRDMSARWWAGRTHADPRPAPRQHPERSSPSKR